MVFCGSMSSQCTKCSMSVRTRPCRRGPQRRITGHHLKYSPNRTTPQMVDTRGKAWTESAAA